jgi:hypothetical protein
MFGCDAKIGLSTSSLPHGLLCSLESEEDLVEHLNRAEEVTLFQVYSHAPPCSRLQPANYVDHPSIGMGIKIFFFAQYVKNHVLSKVKCSMCSKSVHEMCSKANADLVVCHLCSNEEVISEERRNAQNMIFHILCKFQFQAHHLECLVDLNDQEPLNHFPLLQHD